MANPLKQASTKSRNNKQINTTGQAKISQKLKPFQIINNLLQSKARWFDSNYKNNAEEGYKKSIYVYRAIRERAKAVSLVPLIVKEKVKDDEDEVLDNHPLEKLLKRPNPHYSGQTLREFWQMSRLLSGNAYFHLAEMDANGIPEELYYLRPDRVKIEASSEEYISNYIYKINSKQYNLDPLEVIHFKLINPTDDYYGMSTIEAGVHSIDINNSIQKWNKVFFDNAARPDGAFVSEGRMDSDEYDRAKEQIKNRYTGTSNAHKPLLLEGGVDWKEIGKSHKDLDFPELKRWSVIDICTLFEVDPIFIGLPEASSYNNKKEAKKSFWEGTVLHDLTDLLEKINSKLAPRYGDDIYVEANISEVEALRENENDRVERLNSKVKSNYITLNEARVADGKEPRDELDITLAEHKARVAMGMQTTEIADKAIKKKDFRTISKNKKQLFIDNANLFANEEIKAIAKNLPYYSTQHIEKWIDYVKQIQPHENSFKKLMDNLFDRQLNILQQNLNAFDASQASSSMQLIETKQLSEDEIEDILFDINDEAEYFIEQGKPVYEETIQDFGSDSLDTVQVGIDFNLENPRVNEWLTNKEQQFATQVNETTWRNLKDSLMEGVSEGESIPDLANRVENIFEGAKANRSEMIARTEVNGAANFGAHEGYQQSGVVEEKTWIAALDERTRPAHRVAHNQTVKMDKMFTVKGEKLQYPGDPSGSPGNIIQCRCTMVPEVTTEDDTGGKNDKTNKFSS